jgi:hypothetical protein
MAVERSARGVLAAVLATVCVGRAGDARPCAPVRLVDPASGLAIEFETAGAVPLRWLPDGVEDERVVSARPDPSTVAYRVELSHVAGLRLVADTLEFLDRAGDPRLRVAPPIVVDARSRTHAAHLAVRGCRYDSDPSPPWTRAVVPPGSASCEVAVAWPEEEIAYPAMLDPAWTSAGSMAHARAGQTATVLSTGDVLFAGGDASGATAELYHPSSGTFAATGPMTAARSGHIAAPLASGDALVAGGMSGTTVLASAELYHAGTWTAVGAMSTVRESFDAAVAGDATVLVAGGDPFYGQPAVASADVYDPTTRKFTAVSPMSAARHNHTVTALLDGTVLVVGGDDGGGNVYGSAELYDPAKRAFTTIAAALATARTLHEAVRLADGRVFVLGGADSNGNQLQSAELYDPATEVFATTGPLLTQQFADEGGFGYVPAAGLAASGAVFVAGGATSGSTYLATVEAYAPGTGKFVSVAPLSTVRNGPTLTGLAGGGILVAGGYGATAQPLASVELYQPSAAGAACKAAPECGSDACVGQVCCASACSGECRTCRAGDGACVQVVNTDDPSCPAGKTCDSQGSCKTKLGGPCATTTDCATGACDPSSLTCVANPVCDGDHTVTAFNGATTDCSPYKCRVDGTCETSCATVADCVGPDVCDPTSHCVAPPAASPAPSSGGCATSPARESSMPLAPALAAFAGLAAALRRGAGRRRARAASRG